MSIHWNGFGMPPVGAKVEINCSGNDFFESMAGLELEVVMHDVTIDGHALAVFRYLDPEELSELLDDEPPCASYLYHGVIPSALSPFGCRR